MERKGKGMGKRFGRAGIKGDEIGRKRTEDGDMKQMEQNEVIVTRSARDGPARGDQEEMGERRSFRSSFSFTCPRNASKTNESQRMT